MTERIVEGFISIHALLAESDLQTTQTVYAANNFYPRSPCGERQKIMVPVLQTPKISIHALLAESD